MVKVCKEELTPIMATQYNDSGVVLIAGKNKGLEGLRAVPNSSEQFVAVHPYFISKTITTMKWAGMTKGIQNRYGSKSILQG